MDNHEGHMAHAEACHRPLNELLGWAGPLTHRQHTAWVMWQIREMNRPSRSDHYQMQTACEVRRVLSQRPDDIQPRQFKMIFKRTVTPAQAQPPGSATVTPAPGAVAEVTGWEASRAVWLGWAGFKLDKSGKVTGRVSNRRRKGAPGGD